MSVHGNTDWHVDTAEEFLFGQDMQGTFTAANYCPGTWTRDHRHAGLTQTAHFYYDASLVSASATDTDTVNGIDLPMLFFYAGHGSPDSWGTLGDSATQGNMQLGNCQGSGRLRYYWQCSCEVFAHGPQTCIGSTSPFSYACPGDWNWSNDSAAMRNVYQRWGPVLSPDLRMACGMSTSAYCHEEQVDRVWNRYNNLLYDVSDAFIEGFGEWGVVPLCITMGGEDVNTVPLLTDRVFTNTANVSGDTFFHIQYQTSFNSAAVGLAFFKPVEIPPMPEYLPILKLKVPPPPPPLQEMQLIQEADGIMVSEKTVDDRPAYRYDPRSGAVYLAGERKLSSDANVGEQVYIDAAVKLLDSMGMSEASAAPPTGTRMMLASAAIDPDARTARQAQKDVIVTFSRQVEVEGQVVNVLGDGGKISVQLNNDASLRTAAKVWREIADSSELVPVKPFEAARAEAEAQVQMEHYDLARWTWGYFEEPGNVEQSEMRVVYQFMFEPKNRELQMDHPPQIVTVKGQE